jgi:hypothetical protein
LFFAQEFPVAQGDCFFCVLRFFRATAAPQYFGGTPEARAHKPQSQSLVSYNCCMPMRGGFTLLLCAVGGALVGFVALAVAAAGEPALPATLVAVFSPGLRAAELLVPGGHKSLGWTFGWFLRIAILTNALYYFVLFRGGAYFARWLLRRASPKP